VTAREWKAGDRALLPVVVVGSPDGVNVSFRLPDFDLTFATVRSTNLIPDDRRPSWLPGQPGDVAEWGGKRRGRSADGEWWNFADSVWEAATDDDVPADAVLVLPAKTRGVQTWGDRQSDDWIVSGPAKTREA